MSFTFLFILIPAVCYGAAAFLYFLSGNYPLAVTYFGYLLGNIGLLWLDRLTT